MAYYAVAQGLKPGIYNDWNVCRRYVIGYKGAIYKKFSTLKEAQRFIESKSQGIQEPKVVTPSAIDPDTAGPQIVESSVLVRDIPRLEINIGEEFCTTTAKYKSDHGKAVKEVRKIYIDGACRGNGKLKFPCAGYGVFYGPRDKRNAAVPLDKIDDVTQNKATNQRAELFGIKHALVNIVNELLLDVKRSASLTYKYSIYSDSKYAQSCITLWSDGWISNGWKTSQGKPVLNKDIIFSILPLLNYINHIYKQQDLGSLSFLHVRGHRGDYGNEMADKLANLGADLMVKDMNED